MFVLRSIKDHRKYKTSHEMLKSNGSNGREISLHLFDTYIVYKVNLSGCVKQRIVGTGTALFSDKC